VSKTVELTCIECPTGCTITATIENGSAVHLEGFGCRRGRDYATAEVECPTRILTTTVVARGLSVRMVPVRTSRPIPRARLMEAMAVLKKVRVSQPVCAGDVVLANVLDLGVDVVATRQVS